MDCLSAWFTVFTIACFAVMSPGPNLLVTIKNSLTHSRESGFLTVIGLAIGNCIHVAYCLVGIAVIIAQSILLFNVIKWIGAAYLIYLGITALVAKRQPRALEAKQRTEISNFQAIKTGLFTSLLNPKGTMFFLALFTQVIAPETPIWLQTIYGGTVVLMELTWLSVVAIVISFREVKNRLNRILYWVEKMMGLLLMGFGIRLAISEIED